MGKSLFGLIAAFILAALLSPGAANARYLQTDPIGYDDQQNLYAYVHNDPINKVDPDGKQSEEVMDRRNQAFVTAMNECDGGCLETYGNLILFVGTAVAVGVDILNGPTPDVGAAAISSMTARTASRATLAEVRQIRSLRDSVKSLRANASDHRRRAAEFRQNPTVKPEMRGKATAEQIKTQQETRIKKLERDAADFDRQADRAEEELKRLRNQ